MLQKLKKRRFKAAAKIRAGMAVLGAMIAAKCPAMAHASDDLSWLTGGGNGTFDELTSTVKGTGASIYKLVMAVGVVGMLISIIIVGISFATNKNAQKKEENKSHLLYICIGGIIVFGAMFFLGLLQTIGTGFGASAK